MTDTLVPTTPIPSPSRAYPVAACTPQAGVLCVIPFPVVAAQKYATVPVRMTHLVLINSSPFTLLATHGGTLSQVAPFTTDVLTLQEVGLGQPVTVLPQATAGTVTAGLDASVYPTWYDGAPPGNYPAGIGSGIVLPPTPPQPYPSSTPLMDQPFANVGTMNVNVTVPSWVQAVQMMFTDAGTSTCRGFYVTIGDTLTGRTIITAFTMGMNQPATFPVNGRNITINVSTLVQGGGIGNVFYGNLVVFGLQGPITRLTLGNSTVEVLPTSAGVGWVGVASFAGTGQTTFVQPPPLGYIIRINNVWWTMTTAAGAAGQTISLRGNASGVNYMSYIADTAVNIQHNDSVRIYVGANPTLATTEGLALVNNNAGTTLMKVAYDVVPVPWGAADQ